MTFLGKSIFMVTLLWADSWSEFSSFPEETANLAAEVALAGKAVLVGFVAQTPSHGYQAMGALLN